MGVGREMPGGSSVKGRHMSTYFNVDDAKLINRVIVLREMVAGQELHGEPCPLLAQQLDDLAVLCRKLQDSIRAVRGCYSMKVGEGT